MKKFILAICGLPASGKSKLADAIQRTMDSGVVVVRTDEWRDDAYYSEWKPEKEKPVREAALLKVEQLVKEGKSVIHDDTNYYTSMRHELFDIANENSFGFAIVHVVTPTSTALKWNQEREHTQIPDSVIEDISERFDNPGSKYLWDNSILDVDMESNDLTTVVFKIKGILDDLEPEVHPDPHLITSDEFNKVDKDTRQIVSRFLEDHPKLRGRRAVSVVRRSIIRDVNRGKIREIDVSKVLLEKLNELLLE